MKNKLLEQMEQNMDTATSQINSMFENLTNEGMDKLKKKFETAIERLKDTIETITTDFEEEPDIVSEEQHVDKKVIKEIAKKADEAMNEIYNYGLAKSGSFGEAAMLARVEFAIDAIKKSKDPKKDMEKIAEAVHKGWASVAKTFNDNEVYTKNPDKKQQRLDLAKTSYKNLSETEKEKDRVIARVVVDNFGLFEEDEIPTADELEEKITDGLNEENEEEIEEPKEEPKHKEDKEEPKKVDTTQKDDPENEKDDIVTLNMKQIEKYIEKHIDEVDAIELEEATKKEMEEHNLPELISRKLALDHLLEDPDYYKEDIEEENSEEPKFVAEKNLNNATFESIIFDDQFDSAFFKDDLKNLKIDYAIKAENTTEKFKVLEFSGTHAAIESFVQRYFDPEALAKIKDI